ncbi:MAG: acyltransferase family protein [Acidithiobacillus sp.]
MLYLDYLKFLAIFGVIGFHLHESVTYASSWFSGGYLGVDVFLFVSGYLIERSLRNSGHSTFAGSASGFFKKRLSRIMIPMLVITWLVALYSHYYGLSGWEPALYASIFVYNFYLVFHHIPYFQTFALPHPFVGMWFISLLVQLYIAHFLLRKIIKNNLAYQILMAILMVVAATGAFWLDLHGHLNQSYVLPWHGFSYIAGILGFNIFQSLVVKQHKVQFDVLVAVAVFALVALMLWSPYHDYVIYSLATLGVTALYFFAAERSCYFSQLKWGLGGTLGEMSYSLYLWNVPVITMVHYFYSQTEPYIQAILSVLIILLLSVVTYTLVEVRIQRAFSKQSRHTFSTQSAITAAILLSLGISGWYSSVVMNRQFIGEREKNEHLSLYKHYQETKIAELSAELRAATKTQNINVAQKKGNADLQAEQEISNNKILTQWQPNPQPGFEYNGQEIRQNPAYPDKQVLVITDSILLGWSGYVIHQIPNALLDGKVGRQFSRAPSVLREELAQPQNAQVRYVVLELGSNGDVFTPALDQVIRECGDRKVLLIIPNVPRVWEQEVRDQYIRAHAKYPNVYLLHWNRISQNQYNYFVADQVHLTWDGAQALVNSLVKELYVMGYQPPASPAPAHLLNVADQQGSHTASKAVSATASSYSAVVSAPSVTADPKKSTASTVSAAPKLSAAPTVSATSSTTSAALPRGVENSNAKSGFSDKRLPPPLAVERTTAVPAFPIAPLSSVTTGISSGNSAHQDAENASD